MKFKEYFNSLLFRRKSSTSSLKSSEEKSMKIKPHHGSTLSTDYHYEIPIIDDQHSRTQILLARHAHLVNTIVGIRSQDHTCPYCRVLPSSDLQNLTRNYSNTLATSTPCRECQCQASSSPMNSTTISSSNTSLWNKTRQRSKIRTNPWIKTILINNHRLSQVDYSIYDPTYHHGLSSGLIHSESFPQTISNGNLPSVPKTNKILHQSDSGHGFSITSSRVIHSSSPDNSSSDGPILDNKQHIIRNIKQINRREQYFSPKTIPCDSSSFTQRIQSRYHLRSSPTPRDHFSSEFEEIVENERSYKQRSLTRKNPFILPLDEQNVKLTSPLTTLKKKNSRSILKHIEEIENEIQMIKNLNGDQDEQIISSEIYPKEDEKQLVEQWVEECLTTPKNNNNPASILQTQCDRLVNTIKDYVEGECANNNQEISLLPKAQKTTQIMTAFYVSCIPITKRTSSFIDQPVQVLKSQTLTKNFKNVYECPF